MRPATWSEPGGRGFNAAVAVTVILLHALFYHVLGTGEASYRQGDSLNFALRADFIEPAPAPVVVSLPAEEAKADPKRPQSGTRARNEPVQRKVRAQHSSPRPGEAGLDPLESSPPDRRLDLQWRTQTEPGTGFPLAPTTGLAVQAFPAEPEGRFRMRRQLSGKDVIEGTAKALGLWPAGYTTDPCPRIKRNIGALMTDGRPAGRQALAEEVRRREKSCRD